MNLKLNFKLNWKAKVNEEYDIFIKFKDINSKTIFGDAFSLTVKVVEDKSKNVG